MFHPKVKFFTFLKYLKESGIPNDPNDWAAELGNPRYILDFLLSFIRLSVETEEVVRGLPGAGFEEVEVVSPI